MVEDSVVPWKENLWKKCIRFHVKIADVSDLNSRKACWIHDHFNVRLSKWNWERVDSDIRFAINTSCSYFLRARRAFVVEILYG